jgi:hypothetical protein
MAKNLLWPFAVIGLSVASHAQAQIGRTLDECTQSYGYGNPFLNPNIYTFCGPKTDFPAPLLTNLDHKVRYFITAFFVEGKVSLIRYYVNDSRNDSMYDVDAKNLLKDSAPEVVWSDPSTNAEDTEIKWSGSVNGKAKYTARLKGTRSLEIVDEDTNAGGVIGAKREIINGQSFTVLPYQGSEERPNQKVTSGPAPTPAKLTQESAEADLNRAWQSLTSQQRDRLSQEERNWTHHRDSLPGEARIKSTADRAKYLWSFVERSFDD